MLTEIGKRIEYWLHQTQEPTNKPVCVYPVLYRTDEHWYNEYTVQYHTQSIYYVVRAKKEILGHPEYSIYLFHPKRNIWSAFWKGV